MKKLFIVFIIPFLFSCQNQNTASYERLTFDYDFKVGQYFKYENKIQFGSDIKQLNEQKNTIELYVIKEKPVQIALLYTFKTFQFVTCVTLSSAGDVMSSGFGGTYLFSDYFPKLENPVELKNNIATIKTTSEDDLKTLYQSTKSSVYRYLLQQKKLLSMDSVYTQNWPAFYIEKTQNTLLESSIKTPEEIDQIRNDVLVYIEGFRAFDSLTKEAANNYSQFDEKNAEAVQLLDSMALKINTPSFLNEIKQKKENRIKYTDQLKKTSQFNDSILNKPAPDFTLSTIDGKTVSLSSYRGKVVLLDFWFASCDPCMRAMSGIKGFSTVLEKDLQVLGMNVDSDKDLSLAKHVIDVMQLQYPQLRASSVTKKYGVKGYPSFILIDKKGVLRFIDPQYLLDGINLLLNES